MNEVSSASTVADLILNLSNGNKVAIDGSLSNVCTDKLIELYGKKENDILNIGLESYEQDLATTLGTWDSLRIKGLIPQDRNERIVYLYSVSQGDVSMGDVLKFSDAMDTIQGSGNVAAIYIPDDGVDNVLAIEMISLSRTYGARVITSLEQLHSIFSDT